MSALDADSLPRFLPGVRLHRDQARDQWVVLAPERVIELDEVAHAVLLRCDGQRSLATIIEELAQEFDADPAAVAPDVLALLGELLDKRIVQA
jgi:pyrroloquinoline quinone biosynthesis protein D